MINVKKLSNGITVLIENIETVKSVAIGVYVKTGSKFENSNESGISHFLEHMLFKGTKTRDSMQISETIDDVGGHINAFTSKEMTSYYITLLDKHIDIAIDVLSDIYINSVFPEEEIIKEKKVIIEEIRMYEDIPEDKIHELNSKITLKGSAVANSILGTEASVNGLQRDQILKYWNERYAVENTVISIAGNINIEEVYQMLEEKFGKLKNKLVKRNISKDFVINSSVNKIKKEANQVHLCVNTKGLSYLNDDRYTLSIISNILGGNMSSRLFQKIREEKGLAYSVYSYLSSYREGGLFTAYAGSTKDNYEAAIDIIKDEFKEIKSNGVTVKELNKAKNQLLSSLTLGLESTRSRMARMASTYINYGKLKTIDEVIEEINKIELINVKKVCEEVFDDKYQSIIVLGNV